MNLRISALENLGFITLVYIIISLAVQSALAHYAFDIKPEF